mmetsp:Transcript_15995/g.41366  ORF Transcript_15995/g.41366 Transcript_15995/m.41366 type:complete len:209 (-) Transcript_15995:469-1095(-)
MRWQSWRVVRRCANRRRRWAGRGGRRPPLLQRCAQLRARDPYSVWASPARRHRQKGRQRHRGAAGAPRFARCAPRSRAQGRPSCLKGHAARRAAARCSRGSHPRWRLRGRGARCGSASCTHPSRALSALQASPVRARGRTRTARAHAQHSAASRRKQPIRRRCRRQSSRGRARPRTAAARAAASSRSPPRAPRAGTRSKCAGGEPSRA